MKKIILKFLIILLVVGGSVWWYNSKIPGILSFYRGPNIQEQLTQSFNQVRNQSFDCLILGNSRIYRGLNPDKLSIKSYNFAHDHESYNQMWYKLAYLKRNKVNYDRIILGTDYFLFSYISDTRNEYYANYFEKAYLEDYKNASISMDRAVKNYVTYKYSQTFPYFLQYLKEKLTGTLEKSEHPIIKTSGQYVEYPIKICRKDEFFERDSKRLKLQVDYFKKILKYADKNQIPVDIVMLPIQKIEEKNYTAEEIEEFNHFILSSIKPYKKIEYHNLNDEKDLALQRKEYADFSHLNSIGADKVSVFLNRKLKNRFSGK